MFNALEKAEQELKTATASLNLLSQQLSSVRSLVQHGDPWPAHLLAVKGVVFLLLNFLFVIRWLQGVRHRQGVTSGGVLLTARDAQDDQQADQQAVIADEAAVKTIFSNRGAARIGATPTAQAAKKCRGGGV